MKASAWLLLGVSCCWSASVRAEWLTLGSRVISRGDSADPDAPVTGYAYGPRARASLGLDLAILNTPRRDRAFRLGLVGLVTLEDAEHHRVFPSQTGRSFVALSTSLAYREPFSWLPTGHELELGLELGHRGAFSLDQFVMRDAYRTNDVPFGAGGNYLGLDGALRFPFGAHWQTTSRLRLRSYFNALPDAVGQTEASDYLASTLEEGAELSAGLELGVRYQLASQLEPVLRLYADVVEPHDDSAKTLWLTRALFGLALPGADFELEPYADVEAGRGQGLLVNRTELRIGGGIRLYAR